MRKSVKVFVIIASSLVGIGILFLCLSFLMGGANLLFKPNGFAVDYKLNTATFDEVDSIEVIDISNDVKIVKGESGAVKVTYAESEKFGYSLKQHGGKLTVEYKDYRQWFEFFGIFIGYDYNLVVEVPEEKLDSLDVSNVSGDVLVDDIRANEVNLKTTSGDITTSGNMGDLHTSSTSGAVSVSGTFDGDVKASCTSGEIKLNNITAKDVNLSVTSGDIKINNANLSSVETDTMSGDIELEKLICTGDIDADTTSGDVEFDSVNAENYTVNTTSGKVDAEILEPKIYNVSTVSGNTNVPKNISSSEGYFNAETVSGNIKVEVVN